MFQVRSWPSAILHLDGDAFFASVVQAVNPALRGKPVVTGSERGIATAISYEAKQYGITRGMTGWEIKKRCPQCIFVNSDYETYEIFSQKMFSILRRYTPYVEEYSVDEGFADITGMCRPLNKTYEQIGRSVRSHIESSLGITVSVGISITKSLAKLASSYCKPSGFTMIEGKSIQNLLPHIPIRDVWGIGHNTTAYLYKLGIRTAFDFATKPEEFITSRLSKPFHEIWRELRGEKVYELNTGGKTSYQGISDTGTFRPPTNSKDILWAKLLIHIEEAFEKARRYKYSVGRITIFLKTQQFVFHTKEIKLQEKIRYPYLIREELRKAFAQIQRSGVLYRATGCHISDFEEQTTTQPSLFTNTGIEEKIKKIYPLYEKKKIHFGSSLFDRRNVEKDELRKLNLPVLSLKDML